MTHPSAKILVGTPCYAGLATVDYVNSFLRSQNALRQYNIELDSCFLMNESLIPRGRNTIVAKFLANPSFTHLMFIDADISWDPIHIYRLIQHNKDVVGGIYPKKNYEFNKLDKLDNILNAYNNSNYGVSKLAYIKANLLGYVVNFNENTTIKNGLLDVDYIGTGFMMIKRDTLVKMCNAYPLDKYRDDIGMLNTDEENRWLYSLFTCEIVDGRYLSEDYYFCKRWIDLGGKVFADITINLSHVGTHKFEGNILCTFQFNNNQKKLPDNSDQNTIYNNNSNSNPNPISFAKRLHQNTKFVIPDDPITKDNVKASLNQFLLQIPRYPKDKFSGQGIVICGGGDKYNKIMYTILKFIRAVLNSKLPIEWYYCGLSEMTLEQKNYFENDIDNLTCIDVEKIEQFQNHTKPNQLKGYQIKPFALLASRFEDILLIDADNFPLQTPELLFDNSIYKSTGNVFWADYWKPTEHWNDLSIYDILQTKPNMKLNDSESGQILVNKKKCWDAINTAWFINNNSYFFYEYFLGDKDTYQLAWVLNNTTYYQNTYKPNAVGTVINDIPIGKNMLHYDLYGNPMFLHTTLDKDIDNVTWEKLIISKNCKWSITNSYVTPSNEPNNAVIKNIYKIIEKLKKFKSTLEYNYPK